MTAAPHHDCTILELATVKPEPIRWLWPGRIPLGMISLLGGQPGVGKSTIAFSIAAILSAGGTWPFTAEKAAAGDVLILTAEDDPKFTLAPRLIAAGADLTRIRMLQSVKVCEPDGENVTDWPLLLSQDMAQLRGVLHDYPETRLVIFDPLSAYLGVKDSHRDADVRQVLGPLKDIAAEHDVAILGITHLSKGGAQNALARFLGSTGIGAAARAAYLATRHEEQLCFLPVKTNVAPDSIGGLTYEIRGATIQGGIETSTVEWIGQTEVRADDALALQQVKLGSPKLEDAKEFLEQILQDGPVRQPEIQKAADDCGISWASVRRAKDDLKVKSHKDRFSGGWKWYTQQQWEMKMEQEM